MHLVGFIIRVLVKYRVSGDFWDTRCVDIA